MVKLHGFVYMFFFFREVFQVSVLQHSISSRNKKRPNKRRVFQAFEASLGDQATGGAVGRLGMGY